MEKNGTDNELPAKLAKPAKRALVGAGYINLEQFTNVTEAEIMNLHGMGPKAIEELRRVLNEKGLSFASASK